MAKNPHFTEFYCRASNACLRWGRKGWVFRAWAHLGPHQPCGEATRAASPAPSKPARSSKRKSERETLQQTSIAWWGLAWGCILSKEIGFLCNFLLLSHFAHMAVHLSLLNQTEHQLLWPDWELLWFFLPRFPGAFLQGTEASGDVQESHVGCSSVCQ